MAAHRQVLAARLALAAESPADPEIRAEVGRSLTAIDAWLPSSGKTKEAEEDVSARRETLLAGTGPGIAGAGAWCGLPWLDCRWRLGYLL